ncbi:DUF2029 domain-containing protein [Trinickia terrae]|uniref:DUF2029 domain-containing protein n=1 Tax=Trinickia terrae TaxID=2571161 RepID=A0A4V5PI74_9BURK|nr:glycosyltransferase family 87 protein [Trinickia terrae]TKC86250.1 DUF2029 domain-containing protein [Trinickia terrae]
MPHDEVRAGLALPPVTRGPLAPSARGWLTRERLVVYGLAMLVLEAVFLVTWAGVSHGFTTANAGRPGADFSVFWAAARLARDGVPWQAYDTSLFTHLEVMLGHAPPGSFGPWFYPPTFLAAVMPLAWLPFGPYPWGYVSFAALGVLAYTSATLSVSGLARTFERPWLAALLVAGAPCVFIGVVAGQNSLLTAALAAGAIAMLERRPLAAGILIGLLAVKPQFALLFPLVLCAARAWRAFAAAAASALTFTAASVWLCGMRSLTGFFANMSLAREFILERDVAFSFASPTPFAVLRFSGAPLAAAYAAQAAVAAVAAAAAWHVWKRTADARLRAMTLGAAALLTTPYAWHYELAWLGIAVASLAALGLESGWRRGEAAVVALAWLLPLYEYFNIWAGLAQIGPLVLLSVLWVALRRVGQRQA